MSLPEFGVYMTRDGHPCAAPQELIDLFYQSEQDNVRLKSELIPLCDRYHEVADELTEAIAEYFGQDFGEHSSANDPWANALEYMENAPDQF